jgi:hypothetical protein
MYYLFPYDNIVIGILIFILGFVFHWIGQLISIINWDYAVKIGLQESGMPKEYKVYEHATAVADVLLGWIYGLAAIGLILNFSWSYKLAWFPGVVFIYHSINYWFWNLNRNRDGNKLTPDHFRIIWTLANLITGILTVMLAWHAG